ncbi:MAG: cupredoxin domain-containing protein [Pseudomonadota bacterium]|nr:cupredoxin domain-containing protein [Pseudomonadota bacterium]
MNVTILPRRSAFLSALLICSFAASTVPAYSADGPQIVVKDFMFMPMTITIKAGSSVIWANKDDEPHTIMSDTGLFRSGAIDTDETFTFKFDHQGTYRYTCSIHPRMVGTIVVE